MNQNNLPVKKRIRLKAEAVLRFFIAEDELLDNLIILEPDKYELTASDAALYQAIGSIKEYDKFEKAKLVKFLEVVTIVPAQKFMLTHERVSELRKLALKKDQ